MSPTQRTLAKLREDGFVAEKVEQRLPIPGCYVTRDMGGFADGIAWKPGGPILAWQATSGAHVADHLAKVDGSDKLGKWLQAGGWFEIWGWRLAGDRGKRKTWQVRRVRLSWLNGEMIEQEVA